MGMSRVTTSLEQRPLVAETAHTAEMREKQKVFCHRKSMFCEMM